jgi:hypothetical protein
MIAVVKELQELLALERGDILDPLVPGWLCPTRETEDYGPALMPYCCKARR